MKNSFSFISSSIIYSVREDYPKKKAVHRTVQSATELNEGLVAWMLVMNVQALKGSKTKKNTTRKENKSRKCSTYPQKGSGGKKKR